MGACIGLAIWVQCVVLWVCGCGCRFCGLSWVVEKSKKRMPKHVNTVVSKKYVMGLVPDDVMFIWGDFVSEY